MGRVVWSSVVCGVLACAVAVAAQDAPKDPGNDDAKRPKLSVRAQPNVAIAPARVLLQAELTGGADDYEEFYCPTAEWDWGDGTRSESTYDCDPYQPGKSEIRRRFAVQHVFRAGTYRVNFRLIRHDKTLASAGTDIRVQSGLGE